MSNKRNRCGYSKKYPKEYNRYWAMINRCYNTKNKSYHRYGKKGITVCDRWLGYHGLQNFIDDMGPAPSDEKFPNGMSVWSIDRIDNSKGYSPENCRWTNKTVQAYNRDPRGKILERGVSVTTYYTNKGFGPYTYWQAKITWNGKTKSKRFKTKEEAITQRKQWEKEIPLD